MRREELHEQIMKILNNASDQIRSEAVDIHDGWQVGVKYIVGDVVKYKGKLYRCHNIPHTSQEGWEPDVSPSLWVQIMYRDGIRIITDPIPAELPFNDGEIGWWGDDLYKSLINANVYTPEQYTRGWEMMVRGDLD